VRGEDRDFGGAQMRHRQKSGDRLRDDGDRRNLRHVIDHFNLPGAQELYDALEPTEKNRKLPDCGCEPLHVAKSLPSRVNFDDLHYLMQVNQARALTAGVEWFRSRQPRCMGTLYWQLNDCWPGVTSWSCIDGDGRKKPLWYATRKFFADRVMTFQPESDGSLSLYVVNDSEEPIKGTVFIARSNFASVVLEGQKARIVAPPRAVARVPIESRLATPADPKGEFLTVAGLWPTWFFTPDKDLRYPAPAFDADWDGRVLRIRAKSFLRDVCVFIDRLDPHATISDQIVTMQPSLEYEFEIQSKLPLTLEQLTTPPVFQCVNRFGANAL
jgi:beta-mannosidase